MLFEYRTVGPTIKAPGAKLAEILIDHIMEARSPSSGAPFSISGCRSSISGFVCILNMDSIDETLQADCRKRYQRYWVKTMPTEVVRATPKRFANMFDVAET
jgi:hypothetical protein